MKWLKMEKRNESKDEKRKGRRRDDEEGTKGMRG